MSLLLYLHGFNSSPQSKKAIQTQSWFREYAPQIMFYCPKLPPYASAAIDRLKKIIEEALPRSVYLIGSSMGGFFVTFLSEQYNLRAVLINPAVNPSRGLTNWVGENRNYITGERWVFEPQHIDEYSELNCPQIKFKKNYKLLLQTGDEVLDYRDAKHHYQGCEIILEQGGDHSFVNYEKHLPSIHQFLVN